MWKEQKSDTRGTAEDVINHVLTTFWHLWSTAVEIHGNVEIICHIWLIYTSSSLTIDYNEEPIKKHASLTLSPRYSYAVVKIWSGKVIKSHYFEDSRWGMHN